MAELVRPKKRVKTEELSTMSLGYMINKCPDKWGENQRLRVLFDSGCGATLINKKFVRHWKKSRDKALNGQQKQVASRPIGSVKLSSHYQHSMPTETSLVRPITT